MKKGSDDCKNIKPPESSIFLGILFGLVSAGFYVTPTMFVMLGLASISTAIALQGILIEQLGVYFLILGVMLTITTILIYLRKHNVKKLTISDVKPYRAFIGGIVSALVVTYAVLITIAIFTILK